MAAFLTWLRRALALAAGGLGTYFVCTGLGCLWWAAEVAPWPWRGPAGEAGLARGVVLGTFLAGAAALTPVGLMFLGAAWVLWGMPRPRRGWLAGRRPAALRGVACDGVRAPRAAYPPPSTSAALFAPLRPRTRTAAFGGPGPAPVCKRARATRLPYVVPVPPFAPDNLAMSPLLRLATMPAAVALAAVQQPPGTAPRAPGRGTPNATAGRPPLAAPPADTAGFTLRLLSPADPAKWTLRQFGACDPAHAARDPAGRVPLCERTPAVP